MAERLPPGAYDSESIKLAYLPNGAEPNGIHYTGANVERNSRSDTINSSYMASHLGIDSTTANRICNESKSGAQGLGFSAINGMERSDVRLPNGCEDVQAYRNSAESINTKASVPQDGENVLKSRNSVPGNASQIEAEWIEQYEPGVYITLVALRDGTRDLKRVRFRYPES